METDDGMGGVTRPVSDVLLPSMFRDKDWDSIQVTFLRVAEKKFTGKHNSSDTFRPANQCTEGANRTTSKECKLYQKAEREGKGVPMRIWKKMTKKERDLLQKAKQDKQKKENANGGLGSQYS
eukprot:3581471-Ditylum_brightwellii.AAC.1